MAYKVKEIMKRKGIGNKELAEKANIPLGTLNKIIYGETENPTLGNMQAIASALGCTLDDFVSNGSPEDTASYYLDPAAAEAARELYERPELKVLFDASRNVTKEDVLDVAKILEKFKQEEQGPADEDISQDPDDWE